MSSGDKPSRLTGYYTVGFSSAKNRTFYENWVNNLQLVISDIKIQVIWKHAALQGEMPSSAPGVHASKAQHALIRASTAWNCRFCSKITFDLQMCNSYAIVYHFCLGWIGALHRTWDALEFVKGSGAGHRSCIDPGAAPLDSSLGPALNSFNFYPSAQPPVAETTP